MTKIIAALTILVAAAGAWAAEVLFPTSLTVQQGVVIRGGLEQVQADDNDFISVRNVASSSINTPNVGLLMEALTAPGPVLALTVEAGVLATGYPPQNCLFRLEAFNFQTGRWVILVESRLNRVGEDLFGLRLVGDEASAFVGPLGELRSRTRFFDRGLSSPGWRGAVDFVRWTVER